MKVSSASDYSWIYTLLNNNINRAQTSATTATTSSQQISGIANIDGDSFVMSGAGQTRGSLLTGTENDSSALDLKSFLDKVKNGTITQDDLDAMKEKLNSTQTAGAMAPPPPPPQGADGTGDQIRSFLDKVAAGTVTDEDLTAMQTWLSQTSQSAQAGNAAVSFGQYMANALDEAYSKTGKIS